MTDLVADPASAGSARTPAPDGGADRRPPWWRHRWAPAAGEVLVSTATAGAFTLLSTRIDVNPFVRVGQVSGLAQLQEYAALLALPLLAVLLFTAYRGAAARHQLVKRLVCAAVAGLATGVVAGGVVVALRGTPWPLGGHDGDPGTLMAMAVRMLEGKGLPGVYPPGFPGAVALWAKLFHGGRDGVGFALHDLQILCSALFGPVAYLSWRLVLRPFWALLIAVPASLLFLDPIRPYSHIVMIVLVPLLTAFFRTMTRVAGRRPGRVLAHGLGYGAVFGLLFLWYSGWFLWAAPGVLLLALFLVPWRKGRTALRGTGLYLAGAAAGFAVVGSPLLREIVRAGASVPDRYATLSVYADPSYVLGWVSDRSGSLNYDTWPSGGELAGQSGFAVLLLLGVGLGLGLALRHPAVRVAAVVLAGSWLLRFHYAGRMAEDRQVMLYPRTTWIIMYCLMVLAVLGAMALVQRGTGWGDRVLAREDRPGPAVPRRVVGQLAAGAVCAVALFGAMGAGWSANRYMPEDPANNTMGMDAWRAHLLQKADGRCPEFAPGGSCVRHWPYAWQKPGDDGQLWCGGVSGGNWLTVCGRRAPWDTQPPPPAG